MKSNAANSWIMLIPLTLAAKLAPTPSRAQPLAVETRSDDAITFTARIQAAGWTLRLAGPDGLTQRFSADGPPSVLITGGDGAVLADGVYHYELVAVFPEQMDSETPEPPPFGGSFRVHQGAIALGGSPQPTVAPTGDSGATATEADTTPGDSLTDSPEPPISNDIALTDDYCIGNGCSTIGDFPLSSSSTGYLKLKGSATGIVFSDTNAVQFNTRDWQIAVNEGSAIGPEYFAIFDNGDNGDAGAFDVSDAGTVPFRIDGGAPSNALRIRSLTGNVGLGTATPDATVEVLDAAPALRLSDSAGVEWTLNENSTSSIFDIVSTNLGNEPVRHLVINRSAPANQLILSVNGVGVGRNNPEAPLDIEGNAIVRGDLSILSNRDAKADFSVTETDVLLATLAELPIFQWRYRYEDSDIRHIGPVAQDFYAAFGLGSDARFVSPMDGMGVALATIQALDRRGRRMADALAQKETRISQLEERLAALEARIAGVRGTD